VPFKVNIRRDLSLAQLGALRRTGFSVMKSPHVGNIYPNNLLVATAGIQLNCYDRTWGDRDKNFHPHLIIAEGRGEVIGPGDVLTTHARVTRIPPGVIDLRIGNSIVDVHMRALRQALPNADCIVYTDYLRQYGERVIALLEVITRGCPTIWETYVTADGQRLPLETSRFVGNQLDRGIYGLTDSEQGLLLPNVLNILVISILECLETEVVEVYHLSGPDMVKYVSGLYGQLNSLYEVIRASGNWPKLPETLTCHLVPVANNRLAVHGQHRVAVEDLVDTWINLQTNNQSRAQLLGAAADKRDLIPICAAAKTKDLQRFQDAAVAANAVFYDIGAANTFSQHDIIRGHPFFTHPWAYEATAADHDALFALGERQRKLAGR
jgi:hypothetical protein